MKNIFDQIPSAHEVREGRNAKVQSQIENFVNRVSKVLQNLEDSSATIGVGSEGRILQGIHGEKILQAFRQKGWKLEYISDQRDGDFIRISMHSPSYQHSSQYDR